MTTKTLTGTYPDGYTLSGAYSLLTITASAVVSNVAGKPGGVGNPGPGVTGGTGGVGLLIDTVATVINSGAISGGVGGTGDYGSAYGGLGGMGGVGLVMASAASLTNAGSIRGGAGGPGGIALPSLASAAPGGAGGSALTLTAGARASNTGTIAGGAGGIGGGSGLAAGGRGGDGVVEAAGASFNNSGTIFGGGGGYGNAGGAGGAGVDAIGLASLTNGGAIVGGAGGYGVPGAAGGAGVLASIGISLANSGTITGGHGGVDLTGGAGVELATGGSVGNSGAIYGGVGGVYKALVGTLNYTGGAGGAGVALMGTATLVNHSRVVGGQGGTGAFYRFGGSGGPGGVGGTGVDLAGAGSVVNDGTILGGPGGAGGAGPPVGATGSVGDGVAASAGGNVTNGGTADASALIDGGVGFYAGADSAVTLTNFATIIGSSGVAVQFMSAADRLISHNGALFNGAVQGGGGTLELAAATGTINGLGGSGSLSNEVLNFSGFSRYLLDAGGTWDMASGTLSSGQVLTNDGTLSGVLVAAGSLVNNGLIGAAGSPTLVYLKAGALINAAGAMVDANIYGGASGSATVTNFATLTGSGAPAVHFYGAGDRLIAEAGSAVVGGAEGGGGTLEMAGGSGTITGLGVAGVTSGSIGMQFSGFGTYLIDSGADWVLSGANSLAAGKTLAVAGSLVNLGSISGPAADGVVLGAGGHVTNGASALISGIVGAYGGGASSGTIDTLGTIVGSGGVAVQFRSAGDTLVIQSGAAFGGIALGGGGALDLAVPGTISGLGGTASLSGAVALTFSGFGAYSVGVGETVTLTGTNHLGANQSLDNFGTLTGGLALTAGSASVSAFNGSKITGALAGGGGSLFLVNAADTITGLGGAGVAAGGVGLNFSGFGAYDILGGSATFIGTNTLAAGKSLTSSGTVTVGGTLTSSGEIDLAAGAVIAGYAGAAFANSGSLVGAGSIYGTFAVTNSGTLDDDAGAMLINNQSGGGLANSGLIESAAGDTLTLKEVTVSGAGSIEAFGTIKLDAADITGGTVNVESGGVLQVASTISSIGTGVTIDNAGAIKVTSGGYLYLSSNIIGAGSIAIDGVTGTNADLKAAGNVTLSGGGQVSMNVNGFITGYGSSHLTNADTITGGGAIFGSMTVTNSGVIDDDAGAMLINNESGGGLANTGLIESTATGVLSLKDVTVTGSGSITDDHQLKMVDAAISGGTITIGTSAVFEATSGSSSIGSAVKLANNKTMEVISGATLTLSDSITNNGLLETVGSGVLILKGAITGTGLARLTGSGALTLDGATSESVSFASTATGDLVLGASSHFTGSIDGLSKTGKNAVDLQGVIYNASDAITFSGTTSGGTLTISNASHVALATLTLTGNYTKSTFTLSDDGAGGTIVKDPPISAGPMAQALAGFSADPEASGEHFSIPNLPPSPVTLAIRV